MSFKHKNAKNFYVYYIRYVSKKIQEPMQQ